MNQYIFKKKLPKIWLLFSFIKAVRATVFIYVFLITLTSFLPIDLKSVYILFFIITMFLLSCWKRLLYWLYFHYEIDENKISITKGNLIKREKVISFDQIKEINEYEPWYYRLLGYSVLKIYTDSSSDEAIIRIDLIDKQNSKIIKNVAYKNKHNFQSHNKKNVDNMYPLSTKEIFLGSLSPLSIIFFFLILYSFLDYFEKIMEINPDFYSIFDYLLSNNIILITSILIYTISAIIYNFIISYLKYSKDVIEKDDKNIYITRGLLNRSTVVVKKSRIQVLVIRESWIQNLIGIVSLKIICSKASDDDMSTSNILFPFIFKKRLDKIIEELLIEFKDNRKLINVPKKSIFIKLLRNLIYFFPLSLVVYNFAPLIFPIFMAIFVLVLISQIANSMWSQYSLEGTFVHYKKRGIITKHFIIPKTNIEELSVSQSFAQRFLNLGSLNIVGRKNPFIVFRLKDIEYKVLKKKL